MSDSQVTPGLNIYKFTDKMIRNNKEFLFKYGYLENRYGSRIYLRNALGNHPESKSKNWKAIKNNQKKVQGKMAASIIPITLLLIFLLMFLR